MVEKAALSVSALCYPTSLLDDAARLKGTSDVARPVWPGATHKGQLTGRRLVITFVPTTSWRLKDSRRAGAVTKSPSESSHRTRSIAAMTAGLSGSSPSALQGFAFVVIHTVFDVPPCRAVPALPPRRISLDAWESSPSSPNRFSLPEQS